MKSDTYLIPEWPAPKNIKAIYTTRMGGNSSAPYNSFNLSNEAESDPCTLTNRAQLQTDLALSQDISFLKQVHGTRVVDLNHDTDLVADAAYSTQSQQVCAVLTADCLPLLVTNQCGTEVAAIHAGWRGLLAGVIDETLERFQSPKNTLLVWLGAAIGPCHFEVNEEMLTAFIAKNPQHKQAFERRDSKLFANLYELARQNLQALGVNKVYGGQHCSYCESEFFYSYRRDQQCTGRMASLIWLE